jgi:hypothetical protein
MKYDLGNKYKNKDFQIKGAKEIIIREDKDFPFIEVVSKEKNCLMKIPLQDVEHLETVTQRQYLGKDTLIEIIFTMEARRLRIIRLDVDDSEVQDAFDIIKKLTISSHKNMPKLQGCSECYSLNSERFSYCPKCGLSLKEGTIINRGIGSGF